MNASTEELQKAHSVYKKVLYAVNEWGITDQLLFLLSEDILNTIPEFKDKKRAIVLQKLLLYIEGFEQELDKRGAKP